MIVLIFFLFVVMMLGIAIGPDLMNRWTDYLKERDKLDREAGYRRHY